MQAFTLTMVDEIGTVDPGLGPSGQVTTAFAPHCGFDEAQALVMQPDGKTIATGYAELGRTSTGTRDYGVVLARYSDDSPVDGACERPVTTIQGPRRFVADSRGTATARFLVGSSEPSRFRCKLARRGHRARRYRTYRRCDGVARFPALEPGQYEAVAVARDEDRNLDLSPARLRFRVNQG